MLINLFFSHHSAYTGYRRSIGDILETGKEPTSTDGGNELKSTATIIAHQNTSNSSELFLKNEKDAQNQAPLAPPRPAPRSLSTQNSIPMTNGSTKNADETAQVGHFSLWLVNICFL